MPSSFLEDLQRFGPDATDPAPVTLEAARDYCARLTASHYENFSVVTWLTPRPLRPAFASIYAFCRWSDDLGDEVGDPSRAKQLLGWWRGELKAMYEGNASHPVMRALAETVAEFTIPIDPFLALISAFEQDQTVTDYDSYDQLLDYCSRSANPVGHLVLYLGRAYNAENARLADQTCTGLQLANFWQDVARDLAIGRVVSPARGPHAVRISRGGPPRPPVHPGLRRAAPLRGRPAPARSCSQDRRSWPGCRWSWPSTSTCSREAGWRSWI